MTVRTGALAALAIVALTIVTWFSLNGIRHIVNDHTLLHQLVEIEIARERTPTK